MNTNPKGNTMNNDTTRTQDHQDLIDTFARKAAFAAGTAKEIRDAINGQGTVEQMVDQVNGIAKAEGEFLVFQMAAMISDECPDVATVRRDVTRYLFGVLTTGADDTWSGRGNDTRRAHHDGQVRACDRVRDLLED